MTLCSFCGKEYSSKQSLDHHILRIHNQQSVEEFACTSPKCDYRAHTAWELKRHVTKCFDARMEHEIERLQIEHRCEIQEILTRQEMEFRHFLSQKDTEIREIRDRLAQKDAEIRDRLAQKDAEIKDRMAHKDWEMRELCVQKEMEIKELSVRLEMMQRTEEQAKRRADEMVDSRIKHANDIVEKCIDRPTVTNNNHHHNHITNILVDGKTFQEMTDPERIEEIARQKMRPYWLKGQAGVAEFLYNHVICMEDDKKLIACTDASRKKMKYTNEKNEVEDDLGATKFIAKVYQPIKTVSNELHDNITEQIQEDETSNKIDRFSAELKREQAIQAAIDIVRIRDSERNQSFTTKLCSLAKV